MAKVILCGYMATGKTTIAKLLSQASRLPYLDLDEVIEQQTGKTIGEIFEQDGEIKFRKLEHDTLSALLATDEDFILGLGGGTPCYANNHEMLQREDVVSIYLKTGIQELIRRINAQDKLRPLVNNLHGQEMEDFIGAHLFERSYYYHKAKHVVVTDAKDAALVATEIMSLL